MFFSIFMTLAAVLGFAQQPKTDTGVSKEVDESYQQQFMDHADVYENASDTATVYPNRFKKLRRKKKTFADYDSVQRAINDSIASITCHLGLTTSFGKIHDKRLGELDVNNKWGENFGLYMFYRWYPASVVSIQGRLGFLYRYSRFSKNTIYSDAFSAYDNQYDVKKHLSVNYMNFAVDAPLSVKLGGHLDRTTFAFLSVAGGVTKNVYEQIKSYTSVAIYNPDEQLKEDLQILEKKGKYPKEKYHTEKGNFDVDDWEVNSWIGAGLDTKYLSLEYQLLLASGSTADNHRYHPINHSGFPTWRIMVDFSLR